jgi:carboxyl-terminal processing protease
MTSKTSRNSTTHGTVLVAVLAMTATLAGNSATSAAAAPRDHGRPPACEAVVPPDPSEPPPPPREPTPTTITTIGQAYYCIIDNYVYGPVLNSRALLIPAFLGLTQELQRRGLDQANATLPALSGRTDRDWTAFSEVYEQINARLPQDPAVRQAVAEATMRGMVKGLDDNHASWARRTVPDSSGISLSVFRGVKDLDPAATAPMFVTAATGPAERAGILPGDEILAANGVPPFVNDVLLSGVVTLITEVRRGTPLELTLRRPVTNATFTVTLMPGLPGPPAGGDDSKLVDGNVAYVRLRGFDVESADRVLADIAALRATTALRGVVLDLRGNTGGNTEAVARLLGALAHNQVYGYWCKARGHCIANRTDNSVPLLNLRLIALTDRRCASACDAFASATKDLRLGTLVGTRTAGVVSGPADGYSLDDGSSIQLPVFYGLGANGEVINEIGVAPDHYAPMTSADLSAGRDPGLAKAVELLR